MGLFSDHVWIVLIVLSIGNAVLLKYNSKQYISLNPRLESGYNKLFNYLFFYINIPWIVMAIGDLTGLSDGKSDYIHFKLTNPFVLLFYSSIILLLLLIARWIYFKNGAKFLEQHPGVSSILNVGEPTNLSEIQIKIIIGIALLFSFTAIIVLWIKKP
jgi:hypothetical protein